MATNESLAQTVLEEQNLQVDQTNFPGSYPDLNPVDVYRIHLAETLSVVTGVDAKIIYPLLQRTQTLDNGDLLLPVSALRMKGEKPDVLATRWAEQVFLPGIWPDCQLTTKFFIFVSSLNPILSAGRPLMGNSFASSSSPLLSLNELYRQSSEIRSYGAITRFSD
jgi:hypothetical protein